MAAASGPARSTPRARPSPAATFWRNCRSTTAWWRSRSTAATCGAGGRFPQVSGLTIEVDLKRAAGDRIVAISVGGAPLDDARIYKVAINDFLARGGDGYVWFRDAKHVLPEGDSPLLANAVMAHVKNLGTIRNAVEGRILQR